MDDPPAYEDAPVQWQPDEEPDAIGDPVPEPTAQEKLEAQALAEQRDLLDDEYRRGAGLPPRAGTPN